MRYFQFILIFSLITTDVFSQASECWDKKQRGNTEMSQKQFDSLVVVYIKKLNSDDIAMLKMDYVMVVKLDNTIFFNRSEQAISKCESKKDQLYVQLSAICRRDSFFDAVNKSLGPNRETKNGNYHFSKYNLDWAGSSPNENSLIRIKN